jgi:hypothetical protein
LSKPQATVLALWSFGMVLARSCALTAVSHLLAKGMQRQEQTVRQQRRAWAYEVPRQRGTTRHALHVETCVPVLLAWVALLRQEPLPEGRLIPAPWPAGPAWEEASHTPAPTLLEAA